MAGEPLLGKRYPKVTQPKTKTDWALFLGDLSDQYPSANQIWSGIISVHLQWEL